MFERLKRFFSRHKIRIGTFKEPKLSHLQVIEYPEEMTEEQITVDLKKRGYTLVPREATPEDLVEGLPEPHRSLLLEEFRNEQRREHRNRTIAEKNQERHLFLFSRVKRLSSKEDLKAYIKAIEQRLKEAKAHSNDILSLDCSLCGYSRLKREKIDDLHVSTCDICPASKEEACAKFASLRSNSGKWQPLIDWLTELLTAKKKELRNCT